MYYHFLTFLINFNIDIDMMHFMKDLYGSAILFFYFFKWPFFLGYPLLYNNGLNQNYILNGLWIVCIFLIFKDFYNIFRKKN